MIKVMIIVMVMRDIIIKDKRGILLALGLRRSSQFTDQRLNLRPKPKLNHYIGMLISLRL